MIRLSEAIARANCTEEITPSFVAEAYDLLKQSIIRVEMDDIEMDDEERPTGELEQAQEQDQPQDQDTQQSQPSERVPPVSISYDKYVSIMNMLVKKITEDEKNGGDGLSADTLVEWYLLQKEDEISSEQEYLQERKLAYKVIKRLVRDKILMSVTEGTNVVYIIHPNCAILDFFERE